MSKLQYPKKINILGRDIKVVLHATDENNVEYGEASFIKEEIHLQAMVHGEQVSQDSLDDTIMHEIIEHWLHTSGWDERPPFNKERTKEHFIKSLTSALQPALKPFINWSRRKTKA